MGAVVRAVVGAVVGARAAGAGVAAARSAAEIESSVAWFFAARARLSAGFWPDFVHANVPSITPAARRFRILIFLVLLEGVTHGYLRHLPCQNPGKPH